MSEHCGNCFNEDNELTEATFEVTFINKNNEPIVLCPATGDTKEPYCNIHLMKLIGEILFSNGERYNKVVIEKIKGE